MSLFCFCQRNEATDENNKAMQDMPEAMRELFRPLFTEQLRKLEHLHQQPKPKAVYTDDELTEFLGISKKTSQTWRNEGKIGFSQVGRIILYTWDDIQQFMDDHHKKPFHPKSRS